jgi:hypothetical protein
VLNDIGTIYQNAACFDEALIHRQKAQQIAEDVGDHSQQLIALRMIADIRRGSGRPGEALDRYYSGIKLAREIGNPYEEGKILEGIAEGRCSRSGAMSRGLSSGRHWTFFERLGAPEAESARTRLQATDPAAPFALPSRQMFANYRPPAPVRPAPEQPLDLARLQSHTRQLVSADLGGRPLECRGDAISDPA